MSSKEQNKVNITDSTMKRNWTTLLKIDVNDILGKMIEQGLISIDKSRELREIRTKNLQTEALLYEVIRKPQPNLDAFIKILNVTEYDFIVQKLRKDAVKAAFEVTYRDHSDTLQQETEKSVESAMQQSEMEEKLEQRIMKRIEKHQSQLTEEQMQTLMMQMEKQQLEIAEKQTQVLKEQSEKQHSEMAENCKQILKEQSEKQQLAMAKTCTQILKKQEDKKKQNSKSKQKDNNHKECETKIKQLESKIKTLENTLEQERAKVDDDVTNANAKINLLEVEIDQLQYELKRANKEKLNKMKKESLTLRTSNDRVDKCPNCHKNLNQENSDRGQAYRSSQPSRNPYLTPMPTLRAKKGVPKKTN